MKIPAPLLTTYLLLIYSILDTQLIKALERGSGLLEAISRSKDCRIMRFTCLYLESEYFNRTSSVYLQVKLKLLTIPQVLWISIK